MIRFPKMHVAESTSNRILNIVDEIENNFSFADTLTVPHMPSADSMGDHIDAETTKPIGEVSAPPELAGGV